MVIVPTLYIKLSVSYDCIIKAVILIGVGNAYKANVLLLLLSNLVTKKLFAIQH